MHWTVNHSKHFVDPVTLVHTNTIEGTSNGIKQNIAPRNYNKGSIDNHLLEFIWRRRHSDDLWGGFLRALKEIHLDKVGYWRFLGSSNDWKFF